MNNTTDFNVTQDEKMANDNIAEILPTVHIKTRMVEVADEIDADGEMMAKLDLFENDINEEEELRRSLEAEDLEQFEEGSLQKETFEEGSFQKETFEEVTLGKETNKAKEKVATRCQKRTRKGE